MQGVENDKLWKSICGGLQQSFIKATGGIDVNASYSHIEPLVKKILTAAKGCLTDSDAYYILFKGIAEKVKIEKEEHKIAAGPLTDALTLEEIKELATSIFKFIKRLPREYEIRFPLPSIDGISFDPVEIQPNIHIKSIVQWGVAPSLASMAMNHDIYLCVKKRGYIDGVIGNETVQDALSDFKQILHAGLSDGIIKEGSENVAQMQGLLSFGNFTIPKVTIQAFDLVDNDNALNIELPLRLSRFVGKLEFNLSPISDQANLDKDVLMKALPPYLVRVFKGSAQLTIQDDEHANPIKSASEWALEAKTEENDTLAFLQVCLGLECLLGAGIDQNMPQTKTLADRCSYLLGGEPKKRKEIYNRFIELYRERSNLVHGRVAKISKDKHRLLYWGQNILDAAIAKELNSYKF